MMMLPWRYGCALLVGVLGVALPSVQEAQSTRYAAIGPTKTPIVASVLDTSGSVAAVIEESGLVTVWNVDLHKRISSIPSGFPRAIARDGIIPPMSIQRNTMYPAESAFVAVGGGDGSVRVWMAKGRWLFTAPHGVKDPARGRDTDVPIIDVEWTPGNPGVTCLSSDGVLSDWGTNYTPGHVQRFDRTERHGLPVGPDGRMHDVGVDHDGNATAFATKAGLYFEASFPYTWALVEASAQEAFPTKVLFARGRTRFAAVWSNGEVRVYARATLKRTHTLRLPGGSQPGALAFSRDGNQLAVSGAGRTIHVWPMTPRAQPRAYTIPRGPVRALWFAVTSGNLVVTVAGERYLQQVALPATSQFARAPVGADTSTYYATPPAPYEPRLSASRSPTDAYASATPIDSTAIRVIGPTSRSIRAAAFSPSGRLAAVLDDSGEVTIWETRSLKRVGTFASGLALPLNFIQGAPLAIRDSLDLGPAGALVATGDIVGNLRVHSGDGTELRTLPRVVHDHTGRVNLDNAVVDVAITSQRSIIVATHRRLALWAQQDSMKLDVVWRQYSPGEDIRDIDVSPDGSTIAVATDGGLYLVPRRTGAWSLFDSSGAESAAELNERLREGGVVGRRAGTPPTYVTFSRDGQLLATAHHREIRVYSVPTRQLLRTFRFNGTTRIAFSHDGKRLAAVDGHRIIMIWPLTGGTAPLALTTSIGPLWSLSFAPNGRSLIVAGYGERYLRALPIPRK